MSKYAPGYTGPMTTAGGGRPKNPKTQPSRPTPMPKESMLPGRPQTTRTTVSGTPSSPTKQQQLASVVGGMGMAKGGMTKKKGMAKGGMVKKGMAKGGMTKGCK